MLIGNFPPPPTPELPGAWCCVLPVFTEAPNGGHNPVAPVVTSLSGEGASTTPIVPSASQIIGAVPGFATIPGFATVPSKLIHKTTSGKYVYMSELPPETWRLDEAQGECCHSKRPRRGMITDFRIWTECYAMMAAILAAQHPDKAPQLFVYLRTITWASLGLGAG